MSLPTEVSRGADGVVMRPLQIRNRVLSRRNLLASGIALLARLPAAPLEAAEPSIAQSDIERARRLIEQGMRIDLAHRLVTSLTTEVGPRLAGSPGDGLAVAWAERHMRALGLDAVRQQPVRVPHWERGTARLSMEAPYSRSLVGVALGGSVPTANAGVRASVVEARDVEALRALTPKAVSGRIVFLNTVMPRTRDSSGYLLASHSRVAGASEAAALGAMAIVIRSIGTASDRVPHTGRVQYVDGVPRIPAFALSTPDADLLESTLRLHPTVRLSLKSSSRELPPALSANLIGEIRGTRSPEEIVLLGAHLDSWDLGNGAVDDGAGVAIVLTAAALVRGMRLRPLRAIRVVLFANEENGLSGANEYASLVAHEPSRHAAALEADSGADRIWRFDSGASAAAHPGVSAIEKLLQPLDIEAGTHPVEGSSDLAPLRALGVPVFGLGQDRSRYFDVHHSANDTLDRIDPKQLSQAAAVYAGTTWLLAQYPGAWPAAHAP